MNDQLRLAARLGRIKPSATLAVTTEVARLRAAGVEVIDFGAGEPDFETPERIKNAAIRALAAGQTRYTPVGGTLELREAIVAKLRRANRLDYAVSETIATAGGKHALYGAFHALFGEGDEVIVPAPFWVSYRDMLVLAGATPRIVETPVERGFRLDAGTLERAIGPRTRGLVLNSPCNPTGAALARADLVEIGAVIAAHPGLTVISDDVYEMFYFEGPRPPHLLELYPELRRRTVIVNSVSKTYAMTGWRLGYAAGPEPLIGAMATLQGQMTSNPSSISQAGAAEALAGPQDEIPVMLEEFRWRRDYVMQRLGRLDGVGCVRPAGAFYAFPSVSGLFARRWRGAPLGDAARTCEFLLEEARVAMVAGDDFAAPDHVRLSYATSREALRQGFDAIDRALTRLD
ncbi:MAG TPA: pyridoxal phosphate-dependent aminotransferase [Candidatus Bathyarchaeia archaeon]|nr:pyridoxal phosphate-dependent aminotransferase [Candidatus Bathyarchaeia archaeon]